MSEPNAMIGTPCAVCGRLWMPGPTGEVYHECGPPLPTKTERLAFDALVGNRCWLGVTVNDGGGYIGCYQPRPYAAPESIGEVSKDPWVALESALTALKRLAEQQSQPPSEGKP